MVWGWLPQYFPLLLHGLYITLLLLVMVSCDGIYAGHSHWALFRLLGRGHCGIWRGDIALSFAARRC